MDERRAGLAGEQLAREVGGAAGARGAVAHAVVLACIVQQLGHGLDRQRRVHQQHVGCACQHGDRGEVLFGVVGQVFGDRGVHHVRRGGDQQRVAIRPGAGHAGGADDAAGAGLVVHHGGLAGAGLQGLGELARQDVGHAAGRKRHDQGHGLGRVVRGQGAAGSKGGGQHEQAAPDILEFHACLLGGGAQLARRLRLARKASM